MNVTVGHDSCDVRKQVHPCVLCLLVPHAFRLQKRANGVKKDVGYHAEVVAGNANVTVEPAKSQQDYLGLKSRNQCYVVRKKKMYFLVCKKKPVDFDDELRIGDVRYDNMI